MDKKTMMISTLLAALLVLAGPSALAGEASATRTATGVHVVADGAQLSLRWELQRKPAGLELAQGGSPARFILANGDTRPLPPSGWSLYFTGIDRMPSGAQSAGLVLEQIAGGLNRLRPGPGFKGLAPGESVEFAYRHPDGVFMSSKAPGSPYLVYDAMPEQAVALQYSVVPLAEPPQRGKVGSPHSAVSAEDSYWRNARAELLPASQLPLVLPTPLKLQPGDGRLLLAGRPAISAAPGLSHEAALARSLFPAALPAAGGPALRLVLGKVEGQDPPDAYRLQISAAGGIDIVGNSAAGVAYGLQTLRDLLPLPGSATLDLPVLTIVDAPRFGYRGFMLDVARNFHGKETVFKWLDLMARFKLNKFHFHLTDDEGWRIEIAGLPELTAIGAVRGHAARPGQRLQPAFGSGPDPKDGSGSGYYSRADYQEILRYAQARHIEVIPEIEMPGHARAAVQAMEARYHRLKGAGSRDAARYLLNDLDDRSEYLSAQYFRDNVINPGLESSYTFIEHVVREMAALHREAGVPLKTIHMGGDELANGAWEKSPASLAMMKKLGLESTADLWDHFYERVDAIVRRHGMRTSGWEELAVRKTQLDGARKLIPNPRFTRQGFTAYVWNNTAGAEDLAYRLANAGYDIVLTPVTRAYFDMAHNANPEEHGVNWGAYVELDTVYDFIPFDIMKDAPDSARIGKDRLTDYGKRRVRGIQANLFAESVRDPARIDYLVMPRLAALAERAWAADPAWATTLDPVKAGVLHRRAWTGFVNALGQRVLPRLDLDGAKLAYRIAPPGLLLDGGRVLANHVLPGMVLRYTVDGSEPLASSRLVDGPILERGTIRVAAFDRTGRRGPAASIVSP
ncbi:carbohydate-binding domain-containing protein [Massilia sp. IC2-477]|uniref:family 20 glycosylhydrolase n=1 Tax=Massilia sp. IC2-477 TaxID=2887198 RepID=UPI001D125368|nr:family 20 glycosylhydrolase [Massilia sp. IC2-477]MCC2957409.1 carbohydate-binding domain-containing protein [Massilia sp. IC2-477]